MRAANCSITTEDFQMALASPGVQVTSMVFQAISLLTFILGVPGNGLVIWVLGTRLKLTETTVLFLNLSLADLFYLLFIPLRVTYAARHIDWPFGILLCKTDFFLSFLNMYASVFLLAAISMDRCLLVAWPMWYRRYRSMRNSTVVCLVMWMMAISLSAPYLFFADNRTLFNQSICFINYAPEEDEVEAKSLRQWREPTMIVVRFVFAFFIPVVVIVACYTLIGLRVSKMRFTNQARVYRITSLTVLVFFVNWSPYQLFSLASLLRYREPVCLFHPSVFVGYPVVYAFAYVNSCVNPILYVFVGGGFTRKLTQPIAAIFERAFNEELLSSSRRGPRRGTVLQPNFSTLKRGASLPSISCNENPDYGEGI
ncbi:fMet-Leu-Phe receptor-like [Ambystoma mexicanum]|uniref:fMet-Leu-Phe receptor-like n=1 Tax=Ambystoma mexicanum TaxID=8296 RepID=UPI0037E78C21